MKCVQIMTVKILLLRLNKSLQHKLIINAWPCVVVQLQDLQGLTSLINTNIYLLAAQQSVRVPQLC